MDTMKEAIIQALTQSGYKQWVQQGGSGMEGEGFVLYPGVGLGIMIVHRLGQSYMKHPAPDKGSHMTEMGLKRRNLMVNKYADALRAAGIQCEIKTGTHTGKRIEVRTPELERLEAQKQLPTTPDDKPPVTSSDSPGRPLRLHSTRRHVF